MVSLPNSRVLSILAPADSIYQRSRSELIPDRMSTVQVSIEASHAVNNK
jgi:hypothetical protein